MCIIGVLFLYGVIKFEQLATRNNPTISTAIIENEYDSTKQVNLNELNFRIAFAVKDTFSQETKHDPRYVKWFARLVSYDGEERELTHRACTVQDFAEFSPITKSQAKLLEMV